MEIFSTKRMTEAQMEDFRNSLDNSIVQNLTVYYEPSGHVYGVINNLTMKGVNAAFDAERGALRDTTQC
jgi:hypothetical protein